MASACTTRPATCGSGSPTGSTPPTTRAVRGMRRRDRTPGRTASCAAARTCATRPTVSGTASRRVVPTPPTRRPETSASGARATREPRRPLRGRRGSGGAVLGFGQRLVAEELGGEDVATGPGVGRRGGRDPIVGEVILEVGELHRPRQPPL